MHGDSGHHRACLRLGTDKGAVTLRTKYSLRKPLIAKYRGAFIKRGQGGEGAFWALHPAPPTVPQLRSSNVSGEKATASALVGPGEGWSNSPRDCDLGSGPTLGLRGQHLPRQQCLLYGGPGQY